MYIIFFFLKKKIIKYGMILREKLYENYLS